MIPVTSATVLTHHDFERELIRQKPHLKGFALHFTRCHHSAEDLIQETYLKAWKNRTAFRSGTSFKAWLFTIMKNTFVNQYHRKANTQKRKGEVSMITDAENNAVGIDDVASRMITKDVNKAIHSLPVVFKRPLKLYIEGYQYKEIADMLKLPLGTVKCRIHFARKLVRKIIHL
jgi:RNA polymerase sigma-70 factor (ECF subfamily)